MVLTCSRSAASPSGSRHEEQAKTTRQPCGGPAPTPSARGCSRAWSARKAARLGRDLRHTAQETGTWGLAPPHGAAGQAGHRKVPGVWRSSKTLLTTCSSGGTQGARTPSRKWSG